MRRAIIGILLGMALRSTAVAELPPSFRGWEGQSVETISTPQLATAAGRDAPVLREYGFMGAERRTYSQGEARLTVTLWRMQDATGSFGLFTFFSQPGMESRSDGESSVAH